MSSLWLLVAGRANTVDILVMFTQHSVPGRWTLSHLIVRPHSGGLSKRLGGIDTTRISLAVILDPAGQLFSGSPAILPAAGERRQAVILLDEPLPSYTWITHSTSLRGVKP